MSRYWVALLRSSASSARFMQDQEYIEFIRQNLSLIDNVGGYAKIESFATSNFNSASFIVECNKGTLSIISEQLVKSPYIQRVVQNSDINSSEYSKKQVIYGFLIDQIRTQIIFVSLRDYLYNSALQELNQAKVDFDFIIRNFRDQMVILEADTLILNSGEHERDDDPI